MKTFLPILVCVLAACTLGSHVDEDGQYQALFPKTPLSEAPCLEDQDCVVTHLIDGQCCPNAPTSASNLYSRDQFERLLVHQQQMCNDAQDPYTCPEHPPTGHIEYVYQGACVEQRCIKKKVPSDAPHIPKPTPTKSETEPPKATDSTGEQTGAIETAASPKAD